MGRPDKLHRICLIDLEDNRALKIAGTPRVDRWIPTDCTGTRHELDRRFILAVLQLGVRHSHVFVNEKKNDHFPKQRCPVFQEAIANTETRQWTQAAGEETENSSIIAA